MKITKKCICGNKFTTTYIRIKDGRGKFCSKKCQYTNATRPRGLSYKIIVVNKGWFKKGHKLGLGRKKRWNEYKSLKGDKSYIHKLIKKHFGVPIICKVCKSRNKIQWSNKSGSYKEERNDWQQLCPKHHQLYDFQKFGARKEFYKR